jgi:methionine-rich copper-binding protein CopC
VSHGDTSDTIDEYHALISRVMQKSSNPPKQQPDYEMEGDDDAAGSPVVKEGSGGRESQARHGTGEARVQSVELLNRDGEQVKAVSMGEPLTVRVHLRFEEEIKDSLLSITVRNEAGLDIFTTNTAAEGRPLRGRRAGEQITVEFTFDVPLKHGTYSINVGLSRTRRRNLYLDWMNLAGVLEVTLPSRRGAVQGLVHLPTRVDVHSSTGIEVPREPG